MQVFTKSEKVWVQKSGSKKIVKNAKKIEKIAGQMGMSLFFTQ